MDTRLLLTAVLSLGQLLPARTSKGGYIPLSRDGKPPFKPPPSRVPRQPGGRHELFAWVKQCGGWASESLDVKSSDDIGRGLFTTRGVKEGELLVSLPVNCTISSFTAAKDSDDLREAEASISESPGASRKLIIAAYILRGLQSQRPTFFAPYLRDLQGQAQPTVEGLPMFWGPEDGAGLHGTFASELLKSVLQSTSEDWAILTKVLPGFGQHHNLQAYQLAYAFVSSRTFTVSHEELGSFPALCPLIDIGNHRLPEPGELLNSDNGPAFAREAASTRVEVVSNADGKFGSDNGFHVQLVAQKPHKKGKEVFLNYGLANNAHNMVQYGFVVPWVHNMTCLATASVHMEVDKLPDRSQLQEWRKWLGRTAGELVTFQVDGCAGPGFHAFLGFARLWHARAEAKELEEACDLEGLSSDSQAKGVELSQWRLETTCPLATPEAEFEALAFVSAMVSMRREQMAGGTLEEEDKLLAFQKKKGKGRGANGYAAAILRRDEKSVLRQVELDAASAIERLRAATANQGEAWRSYLEGLARDPLPPGRARAAYGDRGARRHDEL